MLLRILFAAALAASAPAESPWRSSPASSLPTGNLWLRSWIVVPDDMADPNGYPLWRDSMTLTLPPMAAPFSVSLNGKILLNSPTPRPDQPTRFKIPRDSFQQSRANSLIIRLNGTSEPNTLSTPPVISGYFDEVQLDHPWEISTAEPAPADSSPRDPDKAPNLYTPADFHPATSVMQASPTPERGLYVNPTDALRLLEPAQGFAIDNLLHEPEVAQPTHVSFDERGRLWVSQYRQYPYPAGIRMISRDKFYRSKYDRIPPPPPAHDRGADRISVHEDSDGDGRYDRHKIVLDGLNIANAALRGTGGLWVMNPPYLIFWPDADGDDVFDAPPAVHLSGFGLEDTHSVANGLAWGPDGWLYGGQGSTTTCRITRPGIDAPDAKGLYVEGCMVWRYHPQLHTFEIFADGGGNTFGISFDAEGRLFTGHNGGDTRGWHQVQDGLYLKQGKDPSKFGPPANAFAFGELPMMASRHPIPRFSHMLIAAEGSALPDSFRGSLFAVDPLHHSIICADRIPSGSTFATSDRSIPLASSDKTFRPVFLANAPDGSITIADFREEYIAHGQNYQSQIDPDSGRIYRLRSSSLPLEKNINLSAASPATLVTTLSHPNLWHRHTAVRLLAEKKDVSVLPALLTLLAQPNPHPALEALWALHRLAPSENLTLSALQHPAPMVRAWALRLAADSRSLSPAILEAALDLARSDPSPEVRCQIASSARRLPASQALPLAAAAATRNEDVSDAFIPLLLWFTIESHCASSPDAVLATFRSPDLHTSSLARSFLVPRLMRRFASAGSQDGLLACASLLTNSPDPAWRDALLKGFEDAFAGQSIPALPDALVSALAASGRMTLMLRVRQRDPDAIAEALSLISDPSKSPESRLLAIRTFGEVAHPPAEPALLGIVTGNHPPALRTAAATALQRYDSPATGTTLAAAWPSLPPEVQSATLGTLTSRPAWSASLLSAVAAGSFPRAPFSRDVIARLKSHKDPAVSAAAATLFPPPAPRGDLKPRIASITKIIASGTGDAYKGEPLFASTCGSCHQLFFKGGRIGPDLTPYQRDDTATLLVSIVDPDAEIREGFENVLVTTKDGRSLGGFLADQNAQTVSLRGFDGADLILNRSDIASLTPAGHSLMPPGLLDQFTDTQLRDLFAYLRQSQPITR